MYSIHNHRFGFLLVTVNIRNQFQSLYTYLFCLRTIFCIRFFCKTSNLRQFSVCLSFTSMRMHVFFEITLEQHVCYFFSFHSLTIRKKYFIKLEFHSTVHFRLSLKSLVLHCTDAKIYETPELKIGHTSIIRYHTKSLDSNY